MTQPSDDEAQRFRERLHTKEPRLGPSAKAAVIGLVVAGLAWKAPGWLSDRAWASAKECRSARVEANERVGDTCAPSATRLVALAFPWTRYEARRNGRVAAAASAWADLEWASARRPSRVALVEAADRFVEVERTLALARGDGAKHVEAIERERTGHLFHAGALDAVAKRDPATGPEVLLARLTRGDVEGAHAAALVASEDPMSGSEDAKRRGALLALFAERAPAIAALRASNLDWKGKSVDARAALFAMGATPEEAGFVPVSAFSDHEHLRLLLAEPEWGRGRRSELARAALRASPFVDEEERLRFLAEAVAPEAVDVTHVAMALSSASRGRVGLTRASSRATALDDELGGDLWLSSRFSIPDPAIFRAASARLLALAETLGSHSPDAEPEERSSELTPGILAAGPFRRAAWVLRLEGASHALALGDRAGAIADAQAAATLAPENRSWHAVAVTLRAGGDDAVIRLADAALAQPASLAAADAAWLRLARARALVRRGKLEAAAADLEAAAKEDTPLREDARALRIVLARRAGEDEASHSSTMSGGAWVEIAKKPPEERRAARIQRPAEPQRTTLAGMAMVALAASPGDDVEVWLDRAAPPPERDLRAYLRARAELARWRGEEGAASDLEARAARLDVLVVDARTALLARIAGL